MVRQSLSLVLGAWERQSELVRRVHRILRRPAQAMSARQAAALTTCLMAAVLAAAAALARSPLLVTFAPTPDTPAPAQVLMADILGACPNTGICSPSSRHEPFMPHPFSSFANGWETTKSNRPSVNSVPGQVLSAANPARSGLTAQMVRAVMAPQSSSTPKPVRRNSVARSARRPAVEQQQTFVVLTEWNDQGPMPQIVFAVERRVRTSAAQGPEQEPDRIETSQPRFAALPLPNGWLIVEI